MMPTIKKDFRQRFSDRAKGPRDRREGKRAREDVSASLIHAEDALLSLVMRQNFDDNAALLFNQQLVQLSVAGDSLQHAHLREQFRLRAQQALGRLKPKADKRRVRGEKKPAKKPVLKLDVPFMP